MSLTHQQYAGLANNAYEDYRVGVHRPGEREPVGIEGATYNILEHVNNPRTGYQGTIYQRMDSGAIVVAHRGTEFDREFVQDGLLADLGMVLERSNLQAGDAIELTQRALTYAESIGREKGHAPEVTVTGHSLGGTLAQISAHYYDLRGETFNAYGAVSLGYRIPEGGERVLNHVMATDMVSAGSPHYGRVQVYATPRDVATLVVNGYANDRNPLDLRAPVPAALLAVDSAHPMHNFLDVDADGRRDRSVLTDPQARQLAARFDPMIDKYRGDVALIRGGIGIVSRSAPELAVDLLVDLHGPLPPGAPAAVAQRQREQELAQHAQPSRSYAAGSSRVFGAHGPLPLPDYGVAAEPAVCGRGVPYRPASCDGGGALPAFLRTPAERPHPAGEQVPSAAQQAMTTIDRMLAAAETGDWSRFRQGQQALADHPAAHAMLAESRATVDREEQFLAQQQVERRAQEQEQQYRSAHRGRAR